MQPVINLNSGIPNFCTYRSYDKRLTGVFAASIKEDELFDSSDKRSDVGLEKLL